MAESEAVAIAEVELEAAREVIAAVDPLGQHRRRQKRWYSTGRRLCRSLQRSL